MAFKSLQVLRLTQPVRTGSEPRVTFPKGERVVVVNTKDGNITVRTSNKTRLTVTPAMVEKTFRGRPRKDA